MSQVTGDETNERIEGVDAERNTLSGAGGDDTLVGGHRIDSLLGGAGNDLLIGGAADLVWDHSDNEHYLDPAANVLDGGAGADTMVGGVGQDLFWVNNLSDVVSEEPFVPPPDQFPVPQPPQDTVFWTGQGAYQLADNVEVLRLRDGADAAVGNGASNLLWSEYGGEDLDGTPLGLYDVHLDGGAGDDTVQGGDGDDTLLGGTGNDRIIASQGQDVLSGGDGDDRLTGDFEGRDEVSGVAGDPDRLSGGAGADILFGGGRADLLNGDADSDIIQGGTGQDTLIGGDGADVLIGGGDDDTLTGSAGADLFGEGVLMSQDATGVHEHAQTNVVTDFVVGEDRIIDGAAATSITQDGADTVILFGTATSLRLIGVSADTLSSDSFVQWVGGTADADTLVSETGGEWLTGAGGDDTLISAGADTMDGGGGADTYNLTGAGNEIIEGWRGGVDTVVTGASYRLGANLENLILQDQGAAADAALQANAPRLDGRGNRLANLLEGSSGGNRLNGGGGDDTLHGGGGADTLQGGAGRDILQAGAGNDLLIASAGGDRLSGGAGADAFRFLSLIAGTTMIVDFQASAGDVIDLSGIDANAKASGDQGFTFVTAFTGHRGEAALSYDKGFKHTTVSFDVDGDRHADMTLTVNGHIVSGDGWVL